MSSDNGNLFNRGTGLLVIEVRESNPNGDPDAESEPRTFDVDGRGLIHPVSYKRKLRDVVADKDNYAWTEAARILELGGESDTRTSYINTRRGLGQETKQEIRRAKYNILETRFRQREEITQMKQADFNAAFWDARVFGNTFLEQLKDRDDKEDEQTEESDEKPKGKKLSKELKEKAKAAKLAEREARDHFISTGVVQFGPGVSVARVDIVRTTNTNKAGVEADKDRGLAPLGWRVVRHGVYVMPFFVNPMMARKNGCQARDIDLMKFLIPHAYRATASAIRPFVEVRHAWYAEHKSPLGSCPDSLILDALQPKKRENPDDPSLSINEYDIPSGLSDDVRSRLNSFEDLGVKQWDKATTAA